MNQDPVDGKTILDAIQQVKKMQQEFREQQEPAGLVVMIPPMFDSMREELECQLLDAGVHVIPPSFAEEIPDKGPVVIGPGFVDPLVARITEDDLRRVRLIESENPYVNVRTEMKRGGNNKPWYDPDLKKRRAKIANQSKRRNRK